MEIFQDMRTWRFWRYFLMMSFACLGALSTILQTIILIFPKVTVFQGMPFLFSVLAVSFIAGLIWSWPKPITQDYSAPNTRITIVKGDMLAERMHLVIGINDTFDTETPVIIANQSLQGQALQALYGGDLKELDAQLVSALASKPKVGTIEKAGKQVRYGVGTIATVKQAARLIFFLAYCEMDVHNTAHSTPDKVWKSLLLLWDEVSKKSNGDTVSIPVIGGGQARLSSVLPAQDAIRFTILSFMFASRSAKVCDELRIVVRPDDYNKLDRLELQSFLSSLRAS
ncbi:MAG TPA: macro domain-containing protein [Eoetvoesiella sp.]